MVDTPTPSIRCVADKDCTCDGQTCSHTQRGYSTTSRYGAAFSRTRGTYSCITLKSASSNDDCTARICKQTSTQPINGCIANQHGIAEHQQTCLIVNSSTSSTN